MHRLRYKKAVEFPPQLNSFLKGPLVQQRLDSSVFARKTIKDSTVKTSDTTGITPLSIVTISPYGRHYHQKAPHAVTPMGHTYNIMSLFENQILIRNKAAVKLPCCFALVNYSVPVPCGGRGGCRRWSRFVGGGDRGCRPCRWFRLSLWGFCRS